MKIRTLIVDDQLMARELLRRMLKNEPDIEIIGMAASGREAVQRINELGPDLVLLDLMMPEVDGFAVIKKLRGEMGLMDLPILIITVVGWKFIGIGLRHWA